MTRVDLEAVAARRGAIAYKMRELAHKERRLQIEAEDLLTTERVLNRIRQWHGAPVADQADDEETVPFRQRMLNAIPDLKSPFGSIRRDLTALAQPLGSLRIKWGKRG